jgi:hypothetical protein
MRVAANVSDTPYTVVYLTNALSMSHLVSMIATESNVYLQGWYWNPLRHGMGWILPGSSTPVRRPSSPSPTPVLDSGVEFRKG